MVDFDVVLNDHGVGLTQTDLEEVRANGDGSAELPQAGTRSDLAQIHAGQFLNMNY